MTKVHAYLARIKDQEKDVIAVPDGAGRALCVSSDKHWTLTREWNELHIIAPLVEEALCEQNYLDADIKAHHATVEALADRLERQAATISELQGSFLRVERERDEAWRVAGEQTRLERDRAEAAERERDAAGYAEAEMERERDEWKASADKWHGEWQKIAPARTVTREDVEKAVRGTLDGSNITLPDNLFDAQIDAVWSLVPGDDPAVFVVRESDIAAVKVEQDEDGDWEANGDIVAMRQNTAEALRGWSLGELQMLARYEAVARAIEAEQAADPILDKALEFAALADWELTDREAWLLHKVAAQVLGQEASDE